MLWLSERNFPRQTPAFSTVQPQLVEDSWTGHMFVFTPVECGPAASFTPFLSIQANHACPRNYIR